MRYDRQALEAAEAEDATAYLAARERRDAGQLERYELARQVGLKKCSLKPRETWCAPPAGCAARVPRPVRPAGELLRPPRG